MKFVSFVTAIASIANVEGTFRGSKHASGNKREARTRQLMMNPGGGGNMDNMNGGGGGGGGVGDRDGCPDFRQGIPPSMMCHSNADCVAPACCVHYTVPFCHASPWECNSSLMCLAPNEVDAGVNIGLPGQPGTGFGGTPSSGFEDTVQVYEDSDGKEVVEIMSKRGEDIKVYQNAAGEEVVEIAQTEDNFHKVATSSQPHKPQQHHFGERKPAAAHKAQTATARHREYVQPEAIENTSGDGSSPDGDTIFGPCTPDQLHAYMYLTIDEDDLFDVGGAVRLHRKGDYPLIWDEDDFEYDETYVGEECLDNTKCWIFVVESTQGYGWQEGKLTFYVNDQLKLELEDTYSFDSSDSLDVFDDLSPWKHKIEFGNCEGL